MKRIISCTLVLLTVLVFTLPVFAQGITLAELLGMPKEKIVRADIKVGTSGRTVVCVENDELVKRIVDALDKGYAVRSESLPEERWSYIVSLKTEDSYDSVFKYVVNTGVEVDGVRYILDDTKELKEILQDCVDNCFEYDGILVGSGSPAAPGEIVMTVGSTAATVFGREKECDVPPCIVNDRAMLPARFIAENLGAEVKWNESLKKVTIIHENKNVAIEIFVGSGQARINGAKKELDAPAFIQDGRTYAPLRFVAEALGTTVGYDEDTKKITIQT